MHILRTLLSAEDISVTFIVLYPSPTFHLVLWNFLELLSVLWVPDSLQYPHPHYQQTQLELINYEGRLKSSWTHLINPFTFTESGWSGVRSALLANGGTSKKRPSPHFH
jgi:hypothetical protein